MRESVLFAVLAMIAALPARGADKSWNAPNSDYFDSITAWTGGIVPDINGGDRVQFHQNGVYDVQFDGATDAFYGGSPRVNDVSVFTTGEVSFVTTAAPRRSLIVDGPGGGQDVKVVAGTLHLGSPANANEAFRLFSNGDVAIQSGALNVWQGSEIYADDFLDIGVAAGHNGTMLVSGTGAKASAPHGLANWWGRSGGTANVLFENGAIGDFGSVDFAGSSDAGTSANVEFRNSSITIGSVHLATAGGASTTATLSVQGVDSSVLQEFGTLNVGHASSGVATLNIGTTASGAAFTTHDQTTTINKTGTVRVGSFPNTGTLNVNGNLTINGGLLRVDPGGTFSLAAGRVVNINGGGSLSIYDEHTMPLNSMYTVGGTGSKLESTFEHLEIHNNATVNVNSGASISAATWIRVGNTGNGTLTVDGEGTSAAGTQSGTHWWGSNGHTANITFSNNATSTFGIIEMARTTTVGTTANVSIQSGADLNLSTLRLAHQGGTTGTINIQGSGSTLNQHPVGDLTVGHSSTGTATVNVGTTQSGAVFTTGAGSININRTGKINVGGVTTAGTFNIQNTAFVRGEIQVGAQGTVNIAPTKSLMLTSSGLLSNSGILSGNGTVVGNVHNDGIVAPGLSVGTLTINGNYTQTGTLEMEFGSPTSADKLIVNGHATLGSQILLRLVPGFTPSAGHSFDLIDWTTRSGAFNVFQYPVLPGGLDWDFSQISTTGVVSVVGPGVPGDFNEDGTVDAADYVVWRNELGTRYTQNDYNIWRANFGRVSGAASGSSALAAVPEPATSTLIALGLSLLIGRRPLRRCKRRSHQSPPLA